MNRHIIRSRFVKVLALIFVLSLLSCGGGSSSSVPPVPDFTKLTPDCFVTNATNPVLKSGDFSAQLSLSGSTWSDPHIIKEGATYYMYVASDDNFDHDIKIYRLSSTDGINWTANPTAPVLQKSAGQWDSQSTETPAVVKLANTYHMFWTGYADYTNSRNFKIGHATSLDGINWTKDASFLLEPSDPFGAINLDFHQFVVAEPAPVIFNDTIYLYFTALGANASVGTTFEVIGLITSGDGVNWTQPQSVLEPDQSIYPRGAPDYYKGYSTPNAAVFDNKVHLFFDVVRTDVSDGSFDQEKIHHAVSNDGISGWVQDNKEIIDFTEAAWTQTEVLAPSVYLDGNQLHLWYGGNTLTPTVALGVGMATCEL